MTGYISPSDGTDKKENLEGASKIANLGRCVNIGYPSSSDSSPDQPMKVGSIILNRN